MIFTDLLKKEVFGPETKNRTLANAKNAKIVERSPLQKQLHEPPSFLKAARPIAITHNNGKPNSQ